MKNLPVLDGGSWTQSNDPSWLKWLKEHKATQAQQPTTPSTSLPLWQQPVEQTIKSADWWTQKQASATPTPEYIPESKLKDTWDAFIAGGMGFIQGIETYLFTNPPPSPSEHPEAYTAWATKTTAIDPTFAPAFAQEQYKQGLQNTVTGYLERRVGQEEFWVSHPELQPKPEYLQSPFENPDLFKDPGYWGYTICNSLAYSLAVMGTMMIPVVGIPAGFALAGMPEAGHMIDELVDKGVPIEQARAPAEWYGVAAGAIEGASNLPFLGLIFKPFKTAMQPFWNTVLRGFAGRIMRAMAAGVIVTQTEGLEEILTQVVHNAIIQNYDETQSILEGVSHAYIQGVMASLPFGIIGGGASARTFRSNLSGGIGQQYDKLVNDFQKAGLTLEQAQVQAVNEIAKTPEGEAELSKAIEVARREFLESQGVTIINEQSIAEWWTTTGQDMTTTAMAEGETVSGVPSEGVPVTPEVTKEAWEMTRKEFATSKGHEPHDLPIKPLPLEEAKKYPITREVDIPHYKAIQQALVEGKPVPAEVLADYPDLEATAIPKAAPVVTPQEAVPTQEGGIVPPSGLETRRVEIKELLAEPTENLPQGVTKVQLSKELSQISKKLVPAEKKLRQSIMAAAKNKAIPESQYRKIFKESGGSRYLTDMGFTQLNKVLGAIKQARPVSIHGKHVITPKTEENIQTTKGFLIQEGTLKANDYPAILKALGLKTDKFESSTSFISETEGRTIIKAMRRKSLMGFATIEQAVDELTNALGPPKKPPGIITEEALKEPAGRRFAQSLAGFLNRTYRVERLLLRLGGYGETGVFLKYLYQPINQATNQKIGGIYRTMQSFRGLLKEHNINIGKMATTKTEVTAGVTLSSPEKIGVYLHSLNADNLKHLKEGNGFSDVLIDTVKNSLTTEEKLVADWLYTYFQKQGPSISHARMYVEGKPVALVDNYFPIRLQWKASPQLDYWQQIAKADSLKFIEQWATVKIPKGFLKERTHEATQAVDLDAFGIFLNHLEAVEHYKAFQPAIGDIQLILNNNKFKSALISKSNPATYQVLNQWLKQVAEVNPLRPANHGEQLLRTMRVNVVTAYLGFNIVTSLKQFPSFVSGMAEIGEIPAMKGLFTFMAHPKETRQLISEYSPQIYKRSFEREIAEAKRMQGAGKLIAGKLSPREVFTFLTTTMDKFAVSSLWRGAFDDYLAKHPGNIKAAAEYADRNIRKTQPFFDVKDLPEYYRSGEFMKALTIFTNQLNQYWNYYRFDVFGKYGAGQINTGEMLRRILWAFVVPALMIGAISRSDIPEDTEDLLKDFGSFAIAPIPIVGSWINSALKGFSDSGLITTEALSELQSLTARLSQGEWEKALLDIPELVGLTTGLPTSQTKRTAQAVIDLATGKTDDWLELIWGSWVRRQAGSVPIKAVGEAVDQAKSKLGTTVSGEEGDYVYEMSHLNSEMWQILKTIPEEYRTAEKGLHELALLYGESSLLFDKYYAIPADQRQAFLAKSDPESIQIGAHLVLWGKLSAKGWVSGNSNTVAMVQQLMNQYGIPLAAVPSMIPKETAEKEETPTPTTSTSTDWWTQSKPPSSTTPSQSTDWWLNP